MSEKDMQSILKNKKSYEDGDEDVPPEYPEEEVQTIKQNEKKIEIEEDRSNCKAQKKVDDMLDSSGKIAREPKSEKSILIFSGGVAKNKAKNIKETLPYSYKDFTGTMTIKKEEELDVIDQKNYHHIVAMANQSEFREEIQDSYDAKVIIVSTTYTELLNRMEKYNNSKNKQLLRNSLERMRGCTFTIRGKIDNKTYSRNDILLAMTEYDEHITLRINQFYSNSILEFKENPYTKVDLTLTTSLSNYTYSVYIWITKNVHKYMKGFKNIIGLIEELDDINHKFKSMTDTQINNYYINHSKKVIIALDELQEKEYIEVEFKNRGIPRKKTQFRIIKRIK